MRMREAGGIISRYTIQVQGASESFTGMRTVFWSFLPAEMVRQRRKETGCVGINFMPLACSSWDEMNCVEVEDEAYLLFTCL